MQFFEHVRSLEFKPTSWLIQDILPETSISSVVGASYTGKSFFALDMALSIAHGVSFQEHETRRGNVAYIAAEGASGILKRIDAWCQTHGLEKDDGGLYISKHAFNFRDKAAIQHIVHDLRSVSDLSLIFVDTLNRNFGGGNENGSEHMSEFIDSCTRLRDDLNCAVCVVHHMGKDLSGARGHSSLYGAVDVEITLRRKGTNDILVENSKQKDDPEFEPLQFIITPVGESAVLNLVPTSKERQKLTPNERLAFEILCAIFKENSMSPVSLDIWREAYRQRHVGDNQKSKDKAHQRARAGLQNKGLIEVHNNFYRPCDMATIGDKE